MTKKGDTWMPLYIGDYLADTSRLTTEQHGAYLLLLMDYWRNGPPLDDEEELASITKLPVPQWRKHAPKLRQFFTPQDGRLVQKRADQERSRAAGVNGKRAASGKAGAAARWGPRDGKPDAEPIANAMANGMANGMANAPLGQWQNDAPSPSPSHRDSEEYSHAARAGDPEPGNSPSVYGELSKAIRHAGISDATPGNQRFRMLVDAGVTEAEFLALVPKALQAADKPFAYLLGSLEGERKRAKATAAQLHQGAMPTTETPYQRSMRERVEQVAPSIAAKAPGTVKPNPMEVLDGLVKRIG